MILLCGIPSEQPLAMVRGEVEALGAPVLMLNQRRVAGMSLTLEITSGAVAGELVVDGRPHSLSQFQAVYTRLMDDELLPELEGEPLYSSLRQRCRTFHEILIRWLEVTPARVVNRTAPMGSNVSKPYQSQLIQRHGFRVPETLVTNDPEAVMLFRRHHGRVVYKSISSFRSVVQELGEPDLERLDRIRWCPVLFQRRVEGVDVRVHTVGERAIGTKVESAATDYRYASRQGDATTLTEFELPDDLAERCVCLARSLGLDFAGIDLRMDPDGEVYCFEVNPSPAFSYYESNTGQPIARAVAEYLAEAEAYRSSQ
ncbi:MAG: glutathione synthase [Gemmatimonadetes bacterium]|nr:glutathione synthase [Gemmatimonadota bacterium]